MARDHALALARSGEGGGEGGVLRFYRWGSPTVSFGRNEPAAGLYERERARSLGVAFVRRPTGGRSVLHDRELTYAIVLPARSLGGPRRVHARVGRGLLKALALLGVPAELADGGGAGARPPLPGDGPCFGTPAAGEVVVAGRKLVGSAQARVGGALLQHGSLLVAVGQERLPGLRGDAAAGRPGATCLAELLGRVPPWEELVAAVREGLAAALGGRWCAGEVGALRPDSLEDELLGRYASEAWTWRR